MNFYNPYFYALPQVNNANLFGRFANSVRGLSMSNILSGTQKTLNIINQAIPIIKEASPMMRNAKTMFKIANEFKKVDTPRSTEVNKNELDTESEKLDIDKSGPTFFL